MNTTQTKKTPQELNRHYRQLVQRGSSDLFSVGHHAIFTEDLELYRLVKDAQDAIRKVREHLDAVHEEGAGA